MNIATGQIEIPTAHVAIGPDDKPLAYTGYVFGANSINSFTIARSNSGGLIVGSQGMTFDGSGNATDGSGETYIHPNWSGIGTYTMRDGTVVTLESLSSVPPSVPVHIYLGANGLVNALATTIARPDGEVITIHYRIVHSPEQSGYVTIDYKFIRIQSVTSNRGYQLKYTYASNASPTSGTHGPWGTLVGVKAINNAVDYCDPMADTCSSLTATWPAVAISTASNVTSVTDSVGQVTQYTKDANARLTGIKRPGSTSNDVTITYDGNSRVDALTKDGVSYNYDFTLSGSVLTGVLSGPQGLIRTTTANTTTGAVVSVTDALNKTTSYQQDSYGRTTRTTHSEGNYTHVTYDARGNVTEERHVSKTPGTPADIVITAGYDTTCSNPKTCNRPNWTRDAKNNQTDYTYDAAHGGVLTVTAPADASGVRPQTRTTYSNYQAHYKNSSGTIVASGANIALPVQVNACRTSTSCTNGGDERRTAVSYGPQTSGVANNLLPVSTTLSRGDGALAATTSMTYDQYGRIKTTDGPLSGTADTTHYNYNLAGQTTGVISADPDGAGSALYPAVKYNYRSDGQIDFVRQGTVTAQSDAGWSSFVELQRQTSGYDVYHRPIRQVLTAGGTDYQVTDQRYDTAGRVQCTMLRMDPTNWGSLPSSCNPTQTSSANGPDRVTYNHYDALSRVWKVTTGYGTTAAADEQISTFTNNGKLLTLTDAEANRTTYEYDGHDRRVKTFFPSPTTDNTSSTTDYEQVGYDPNGNVTSLRTRRGETLTMTYDNLNRLTLKDVPARSGLSTTHTRDVHFGYDLFGNMTYARFDSTSGEGITNVFNALGQLTSSTTNMDGVSRALGYLYDTAGSRAQVTHPDGNYFHYHRHASGAPYYTSLNGSSQMLLHQYDSAGRLFALHRFDTTAGAWNYYSTFGYDAVSRLSSFTNNLAGTTYDSTTSFTYNPASQIATSTRTNDSFAWLGATTANRNYTPDGLNRYSAVAGVGFGYDLNGNLTSDGTDTYVYDVENRLVSRTSAAGTVSLRYDPLGRLHEVYAPSLGAARRFLYDGSDLVAEYNFNAYDPPLRRYVHGLGAGDDPLVWFEGGGVTNAERRYLYADERGSIVAYTNSSGTLLQGMKYDEYGIPATGYLGAFQYTGQVWLPELGMNYYKARMYSPTLGRFMQTDPIGYGDGMNMYAYVGNDPVNGVDPTGLDGEIVVTGTRPPPPQPGDPKPGNSVLSFGLPTESPRSDLPYSTPDTSGAIASMANYGATPASSVGRQQVAAGRSKPSGQDVATACGTFGHQSSQCRAAKERYMREFDEWVRSLPPPQRMEFEEVRPDILETLVSGAGCLLGMLTGGGGGVGATVTVAGCAYFFGDVSQIMIPEQRRIP